MKNVVIVTICIHNGHTLHFNGVYLGKKINKIRTINSPLLTIGHEYIVYAKVLEITRNEMIVEITNLTLLEGKKFNF